MGNEQDEQIPPRETMAIDGCLIALAADGDRAAREAIYETLVDRVHRVVVRIVGSEEAEDVTQDAFLQVFSKLATFRREADFVTWVHRVVINVALQSLRRRRRQPQTVPFGGLSQDVAASRDDHQRLSSERESFMVALNGLDVESRLILELKVVEQLSYRQIAEILDIPPGTVGSRLSRARSEMRSLLTAQGWEIGEG